MRSESILFAVAAVCFLALPAHAEFYKYRDESGVIRYTDNLAAVPPDQRPRVERYAAPEDFAMPSAEPVRKKKPGVSPGTGHAAESERRQEKSEEMSPEEITAMLSAEKAALAAEYERIQKEKAALDARRKGLTTPAAFRGFNTDHARLRDRAAAYEKRRKMFEVKARLHNVDPADGSAAPADIRQ